MCDCFHVVLPTWPGAPGSVSGRQLQQQEPEAETEDDYSVTEGPVGEVVRPRPQGSSPVYEYTAEGAGFGGQETGQGRHSSSGRRRSWWRRDSGESTAFASMSHPGSVQESTEVTLKTDVESGASGYSVTGGGDQGIFVKQVLKDSSAAKLFNLREGDQLLSATIFFDHMKYEDALKILQYSEPYKVQFKIKRKLSANEGEEGAVQHPQQGQKGKEKQDIADGCTETPTKSVDGAGDRERLISKSRDDRHRRPQDRFSWPKFQALRSKRRAGPRRSHSSSEASEHRDTRDLSPTSTDTELQLTTDREDQSSGAGRQRRRFLNLRIGMTSGQSPVTTEQKDSKPQDRREQAAVLGEGKSKEDERKDTQGAEEGQTKDKKQKTGFMSTTRQKTTRDNYSNLEKEADGKKEFKTERHQKKKKQVKKEKKDEKLVQITKEIPQELQWEDSWEEVQSLEIGIARLSLKDTQEQHLDAEIQGGDGKQDKDMASKDTKFKMPKFKMPSFSVSAPGKPTVDTSLEVGAPKVEGDMALPYVQGDLKPTDVSIQLPSANLELKAGKEGVKQPEDQSTDAETPTQAAAGAGLKGHLPKVQMPSLKMPKVDVKGPHVDLKAPKVDVTGVKGEVRSPDLEVTLPGVEVDIQAPAAKVEGDKALGDKDLATKDSKFKMPKFKMPSFGVSVPGKPTVDASLHVGTPKVEGEVALPSVEGDLKTPDISIQLPSAHLELRPRQEGVKLAEDQPTDAETSVQAAAGTSLKGHLPKVQMPSLKMPKVDLKGPHVDVKGPKVDEKGPKVDVKGAKGKVRAPDLDVALPGVEVDIEAPCAKLEGDVLLGDQDVAAKDSRFKMPKFKMPSFSVSASGKPSVEASLEVGAPKVEGDVALPSVQGDLKTPDVSIQLPSTDLEIRAGQEGVNLMKDHPPDVETHARAAAGGGLKGHMPKVHMPSIKMPKVELKGPHVDMKGPKLEVKGAEGEVSGPELEVSLPGVEVDIQAPSVNLEGDVVLAEKDLAAKDTKFKMPKFKMPSFGVSIPGKPTMEASLEVGAPKVEGDVALPSGKGDLKTPDVSIQLPSAHLDLRAGQVGVKLAEDQPTDAETSVQAAAGVSLKGHLPKVQMPSLKMPKVDVKGPHVDLKDPKVDVTGVKGEVRSPDLEVTLPGVEVDIQAPAAKVEGDKALGDKDLATKDSKFKMPKFKMPSFRVSAHGKPTVEASLEVGAPKVEGDVVLPSVQGDKKTPDVSIQLPSAHLDLRAGQVGLKLAEDQPTDAETSAQAAAGASLKGHLPKVQMPSLKMPKVDVKGPHVDLKVPKVDMTGDKGEVRSPELEVALPGVEVDIQGPAAKVGGDMALGEKEVATKDSKFKMPKFKMPSFGVSVPGKPTVDASLRVGAPKVEGEVVLPSVQGDLKTPDVSMQLPSADLELRPRQEGEKLSEDLPRDAETSAQAAAGASLKGHLPKVQMPSLKVPKVDLKGPHVDVKGPKVDVKDPKVDVKGAKGEVRAPDLDVALPGVEVDIQAPCAKLEGDVLLGDQDVAGKDTKFKMPKFKMPSFSVSASGKPSVEASLEVGAPKVEGDVALPSVQGDLKTPDVSIQLPSTDLEIRAGQVGVNLMKDQPPDVETHARAAAGGGLKGHMPKVHMPSIKMPKVELKGPHVDMKGPKLEVKGAEGEVSGPELEVSLPGVEVDIQAPSVNLEGDVVLAEKDLAAKDTKFKMPKFKMPSFGVSIPGKPTMEASLEVGAPKVEGDVALPSGKGDLKTPDVSIQLPSAHLDLRAGQVGVKLAEDQPTDAETSVQAAAGVSLKGHLPKVQMPSLKMPKVDVKGPHVDLKDPKVDVTGVKGEVRSPDLEVTLPGVEVDIQAPAAKVEGDKALGDKDLATKDSKFKMPKFKMPSFRVSAHGKPTVEASLEVGAPKVEGDVVLPSVQGDKKTPDVSIQLPSAHLDLRAGQVGLKLAEDQPTDAETSAQAAAGASLKGHLPKVQMPSLKMPKVDVKGPHVDLKVPKVDMTGDKGEVRSPELEVALPGVEVDIQGPAAKVGGDMALGEKEVATKDSKFKMPKFKMPSFGVSVPGKPTVDASLRVGAPKVEGEVVLPSVQGDLKTPDVSMQLPSADLELRPRQEGEKLSEDLPRDAETSAQAAAGASLKGHLPKVQMPSLKVPKVDLKGPHVDVKGPKVDVKDPKVDVKGAKGEVRAPDLDVALPGVEVDIQAPCAKLEGDVLLGDQDVAGKDTKFKMPKFKMPSFSVSASGKPSVEASLEVGAPKVEGDVALPSVQGDLKTPDVSIQLPSTDLEIRAGQVGVNLMKDQPPDVETHARAAAGGGLKGHMPKVHMPSIKMPKVELKGPHVDMKGPKLEVKGAEGEVSGPELEVSLPGVEVDIQAPSVNLEGDVVLAEKDLAAKDTKFKMPKFKMPSFGLSAPGKPTVEASLELVAPKVERDVVLPSVKGDLKTPDVSIQLPSAHLDLRAGQVGVKLAEDQPTDAETSAQAAAGASLKGHLPKVQMPSLKMPKVDVKGPHVDLKVPKVDMTGDKGEVRSPDLEVALPGVEVDIQGPAAKVGGDMALGEKEVATKDSKFKMPKFKMPSFGVSVPGKPTVDASLRVGAPKVEGEVVLPSVQGDLKTPDVSMQLPSADLELRASQEGQKLSEDLPSDAETSAQAAAGASLKGHLPKVQMPSLKVPKVDLKGPHVDVKGPKVDVKAAKDEVRAPDLDVTLPSVEVDIQAPCAKLEGVILLGDQDVAAKDTKFKMPKFKMPSFGVSAPGKPTVEASLEVGAPKVEGDVALPSVKGDLKTTDASIQLPSAHLDLRPGQVGVKLSEDQPTDAETSAQAAAGASLKGHLPKVQMPSLKMPKVDVKGPHVDLKVPKVDMTGDKGEVRSPELEVALPGVEVDIQGPAAKVGGDMALGEKEVATKDSKFKMPKFKMPSFGVSVPGKPTVDASLRVGAPKVEGEVVLPSVQGDLKTPDVSMQLPSADLELRPRQEGEKLSEDLPRDAETSAQAAAGASLKGHLPKVQMPSLKVPKVDLKGPHVDVKGPKVDVKDPKVDVKGAKGEVRAPDLDVALPGVEVDIQAPCAKLEGDVLLGDQDVAGKDTKFKMPKFKMPSFSVSASGKPSVEASLEVGAPKVEGDVALPSVQGDLKTPDVSIQLPSTDLEIRAGQVGVNLMKDQPPDVETHARAAAGGGLKGHMPKVHMPSIKMPKVELKGPHVDMKGPKLEVKGAEGEVSGPELEVSLPGVEVDIQAPSVNLEGDVVLAEKDLAAKDTKFKMPKFKMPSFGVSTPGKPTVEASLKMGAPKVEGDVVLPSVKGDLKTPDVSIQLPSAHLDLRAGQVGVKLAEDQPTDAETSAQAAAGASLKGHLPKVQMPSLKMPKVDVKGPHVDLKVPKVDMTGDKGEVRSPDLEVALPGVEVDIQGPAAKVGGDMALGEKEVATKDSKFKMPKFKMPSFGVSVPGKPTVDASLRVGAPKVEGEVVLPSVQGDLKTPDVSMQLPSADLELRASQEGQKLSEDVPSDAETSAQAAAGASLKGHLPKVQMPSLKVPKVDLKGPHVDVKGPKVDVKDPKVDVKGAKGEVRAPDLDVALPRVEVDIQAPCAKLEGDVLLGDQDVAAKDTKFKMPKFKMPSFGVSMPGKPTVESSLEVGAPKVEGDVVLPSVQGDLRTPDVSIQLPSTDLEIRAGQVGVKLPDVETPAKAAVGGGLKGHLPEVQMPSLKMPKVELKGPHVDVKGPTLEVKGAEGEVSAPELEVSLPGVEVDIQAPSVNLEGDVVLAEKDLAAKDTKFKMPKFKMPSFGVSAPGKPSVDASLHVGAPKVEGDVALPSVQDNLKTPEVSIQLPSADLELREGQVGLKLPQDQPTNVETSAQAAAGGSLKGHLPKVQMPSLKMPKVDLKGPHVDVKGPKVDVKGSKGEVRAPDLDVTLPGVEVDIQPPCAKLEGDIVLGDQDVAAKDTKFKMPKFKMPSFGVSVPGKPTVEASLEVGVPKVEGDVALPSVQGDLKTPDVSIQLPSAHLDLRAGQVGLKLAEDQSTDAETSAQAAAGVSLKGQLPKVQMPSLKMPKVDVKGPHVDLKPSKVDVTGVKGEVRSPELEVALPGVEVDIQGPAAKLGGDMALGEKEVATKDSKFKMPKFKMPSFGVSVPGKPTVDASLRVGAPKVEGEVVLPSVQGDLKTPDVSMHLPSAVLELRASQEGQKLSEDLPSDAETSAQAAAGASLKGHLPKVQMPSCKVPKVDLKGPHVDVKGPKVDVKGPKVDMKGAKGEVRAPDLDVALPRVEVDIQAPCAKLEGDVLLGDQDVAAKDTKFKMPKFKMPSFGVSMPGKPSVESSLEVGAPKVEGDVVLPSVQGDLKTPDVSIQLPSTDLEIRAGQVGVKLPDVETPAKAAVGGGLKGHLPEVQMPSLKMPKVELKGPHVDVKGPTLEVKGSQGEVSAPEFEVSLPGVEVDIQAPSVNLEGDLVLAEKDLAAKDTKFKMPKFKMPSFGVSAPGKPTVKASLEVGASKVEGDVALPSVKGDLKTPDVSIQLPSAHLDLRAGQVGLKLAEDQPTDAETSVQAAAGVSLKGQLPKVQMPSLKMPKVDVKGPHVDLKAPKVGMTGVKGEVRSPDLEVTLPGVEVDIQAPAAKVEGDKALGDKDLATKDSKFKMPKFKMPSFGVSVPGKPTVDASLHVGAPKVEGEVSLPSVPGDLKTPDISIQLPSADLELRPRQEGVKLAEDQPTDAETSVQAAAGTSLKGHLPKVQMPSLKMPKVDVKGPHVDLKAPKVDVTGVKGEVRSPELEVALSGVVVDIQGPAAKLGGDMALGEKEVATKDSKFKMPKFKMPSFGVSVPGKPTVDASLRVGAPKVEGEVVLPSVQGDLKTPDVSMQLPSADLELRASQEGQKLSEDLPSDAETSARAAAGASLKGHLPKVQMPSLKVPKVDLKGPHVDVKGPKVDVKGPKVDMKGAKGEVRAPDLDVALPRVEVDIQAPCAKLEGDVLLGDQDVAAKDTKFKMPKFKMPSFGVSMPGKPTAESSLELGAPKVEGDVALPSVQGDLKTPDVSIQLPSTDLEIRAGQVGVKLPDVETPAKAAVGGGLKGHLPEVQMPSLKMPKVELKGPHVDVKGPTLEVKGSQGEVSAPEFAVSLPGMEMDIQAPSVNLEGDVVLAEKDLAAKDTKFKMPKFKMPSFGLSAPGKPTVEASLELVAPKVEGEVALPSVKGDLKTPEVSVYLPSAHVDLRADQVGVKLAEDQLPESEMLAQAAVGTGLKGHLPKVKMPSLTMPKVDVKGPHVDLKAPQVDMTGVRGEVRSPDLEVTLPGVELDIPVTTAKLGGDMALGDKEVATKDSKFKMPKFKMPSFGVSVPRKPTVDASLELGAPKVEGDVALPSVQGDLKTPDISIQLPSADLELRARQEGMMLAQDQPTDAETPAQAAAGASLKGHLPKVQMPSLKMPKVEVKGHKVDVKGAKGEVRAPDLDVALPGVEVDIQAPCAKLEGYVVLGDQDVAAKDSKFKMPKIKMPSFSVSMPGKPTVESSLEVGAPKVEGDVALPSVQGDLKTPDVSIQLPSTDLEIRAGQMDVMVLEHQSSDVEMSAQAAADAGPKGHLPTVQIPRFKMSKVDVKGPHVEVKGPKVDVTGGNDEVGSSNREGFFHYPDDDVSHAVAAFPADGFPGAVVSPSPHTSQSFYSYVGRSSIMVDPPPGSLDSTLPQFSARILFPKFHKPKFVLSLPPSESECPPSVPEAGVHSPQASDTLSGSAAPQVPSSDASDVCILDVSSSQSLISPPPETSTLEMKDTSFKLPSIKLPSLHWSPKKTSGSKVESDSQESPLPSLGLSSAETDSEIQSEVSIVESPQHGSLDKEVDKGRGRKLSFSLPRLALPKVKVSKGSAAVPQGDLRPSLTGTTSGGDLDVIETAVSDAHFGDTHSKDVTTELHVRASSTTAELPTSETELPPPKDDLNVRGDGKSLKTVSPSQPFGELATPRTEGLPQPSGRQGDSAPTVEDLEMDPTAKEMSTDSKERRFRIPKFRVPGFRRSSSKDRDRAGEQEAPQKSQTPVIDMPSEAEETAAACMQLSHVPESKIETHISLGSPEEGTGVRPLERPTYAEVVKHDLHGTGSRMHHSTVELSRTHLPTPECGSQGSISLEVPGVRVSEPQLPPEGTGREQHPGPGGNILDEMEARTGHLASQPQGPLRLKASLTEVPSQVSVVSMSQLWEDSVLTVTFPKLKVPRFSFPAPSSEADVFFPVVREVEASIDSTVHKGSPGLWEASILKTGTEDTGMPPASPEQSSEASPISKVRVHIQGSRGESQEVAISSRVEGSSADPLVPGPLCTQIVRESEIPASTIQTPSYGFSLLKVKIPEPPMQACVYTVGPDSQEGEGGVPMPAAAGGHSIPAEVPPDTGEPFEIISSGTGMPPGPQLVDGTSDEEPAEILEFPEDSQEVKAPDTDTKQKAEGKKSSLLWSWLPSIGFSSVEETAADSRDTTQRSPVHVQPTARLDPELPRKQEKAGWFRFPKLGFSSSPTKKPRSTEDVEGQAEHKLQEETVTFFDARESFSPEEEEEAKSEVTSAGPGSEAMVTSSARTELVLLEQTRDTGDKSIPRPVAK
nr:protein AHNAK2 isoform X8 [Rattus norvegicus]